MDCKTFSRNLSQFLHSFFLKKKTLSIYEVKTKYSHIESDAYHFELFLINFLFLRILQKEIYLLEVKGLSNNQVLVFRVMALKKVHLCVEMHLPRSLSVASSALSQSSSSSSSTSLPPMSTK